VYFALKGPPKWSLGGDFRGRGEDSWWESTSVLKNCAFSDILNGADLMRGVLAFCRPMDIAIAIGENLGN